MKKHNSFGRKALCLALMAMATCGCSSTLAEPSIEANDLTQNSPRPLGSTFEDEVDSLLREVTFSEEEYQKYRNKEVSFDYSNYSKTTLDNNFLSRRTKVFHNINQGDVSADLFYNRDHTVTNHPNIGLGILLHQAIQYKYAYPEKDNEITLSSFYISVLAGINLCPSSPYYGTMKTLVDQPADKDGFVRFSHLLYVAAKIGIKVNVLPQLKAYSDYNCEIDPRVYFPSVLDEPCAKGFGIDGKKVSDFLNFRACDWVSYGGKSAVDMYHTKVLAAEHYLDKDGKIHDYGVFFSSANLDGINHNGVPSNAGSQTGAILTGHKYIYQCTRNFVKYVMPYCGKEDSSWFRFDYLKEIRRQTEQIKTKGHDSLADEEMMIYLGSNQDKVFRLYFSPLASSPGVWDKTNPFCEYIDKLSPSREPITLIWNGPKMSENFGFIGIALEKISRAFLKDRGVGENLFNLLEMPDVSYFGSLQSGINIGKISATRGWNHEKDLYLSYEEKGTRKSVALMNSMNIHQGAQWYQTNFVLVIEEDENIGMEFTKELASWLYF